VFFVGFILSCLSWFVCDCRIRYPQSELRNMSLAEFVVASTPPSEARTAAARAVLDTVGVALAGAMQPAARVVQRVIESEGHGSCRVLGTTLRSTAGNAALANGTAAHALDYDDMCFVSLAHPSAPLVAAALAAADVAGASGTALLDAYVVGFELEGRLGRAMNPRHYQRGWHCTSTVGTIGAAAAASRLLALDVGATAHALAIAASEASGLKENFGTMVKPLHAGLAARNGVLAAQLAKAGMTASASAMDGAQGFLAAMDSETPSLDAVAADLGTRWEIVETGITVKLYPSCAGTHPTLDALLDLRREHAFTGADVDAIDIGVDPIVPTILIYDRPSSGLEGKFSMPFCAAAAVAQGRVGLDTFDASRIADPAIQAIQARVAMRVDSTLDASAPALTQARVTVRLRDGRVLTAAANGARGYHDRPASDEELATKFLSCAVQAMSEQKAREALEAIRAIETSSDLRSLMLG
jgi:2-methylcitrate dehydratase PrpD